MASGESFLDGRRGPFAPRGTIGCGRAGRPARERRSLGTSASDRWRRGFGHRYLARVVRSLRARRFRGARPIAAAREVHRRRVENKANLRETREAHPSVTVTVTTGSSILRVVVTKTVLSRRSSRPAES